jgi:hypothetical protein
MSSSKLSSPKLIYTIFTNSVVTTSKKTQHFFIRKTNCLKLSGKIITVYSENHMKPINTYRRQNAELHTSNARFEYNHHCASKDKRLTHFVLITCIRIPSLSRKLHGRLSAGCLWTWKSEQLCVCSWFPPYDFLHFVLPDNPSTVTVSANKPTRF